MIVRDAESDDGFQPVGVWGCGCPVGSSAVGRSTDRAGRRDQQHLRYIRRKKIGLYTELLTTGKLDSYLAENSGKIDYIHGEDVVRNLAAADGAIGFLLPSMTKAELFPTVIKDGALPRKTFSMGHANDKRFYCEARKIRV